MDMQLLCCGHCGADNAVAACRACGRYFVVTDAHLAGEMRSFESKPVGGPTTVSFDSCDFCAAKSAGLGLARAVQAGLAQQTCPSCHTEFLSGHCLWQHRAPLG
jgi:hypothetical protein